MSEIAELSEPPYGAMRDELVEGRVIPFLGAGASLSDHVPPSAPWKDPEPPGAVRYVPSAGDLACYLAEKWAFPLADAKTAGRELSRIAQYCTIKGGRTPLRRTLHKAFDWDAPLRPIHEYLASIPKPLLIITTNYDDILERAFALAGREFDVVVHTVDSDTGDELFWTPHGKTRQRVQASNLPQSALSRTIIFKIHGTVDRSKVQVSEGQDDSDRGDFVITEDDYIYFLTQLIRNQAIPAIFAQPLQERHFLFLGYSLSDWNMRVVLNHIEERRLEEQWRKRRGIKSWAIQRDVDPIERIFWEQRGVDLYRMEIDAFVKKLR